MLLQSIFIFCLGCTNSGKLQNRVGYANTGAVAMIEGQRSVVGRLVLTPLEQFDTPKIFLELQTGEKITPIWPELNQAMLIETPMSGLIATPYRDRKEWWKRVASDVDATKFYSIELLVFDYEFPNNTNNTENEILRISDNGHVLSDSSQCQIHKLPMSRIISKTIDAENFTTSFFQLKKKNFPNDGFEYVGCGGNGVHFPVWKCPICALESSKYRKLGASH